MNTSAHPSAPPIRLSSAAGRIRPSASNAASQYARELAAQGKDIISLTAGEPDFDVPAHVQEAAMQAIRDGHNKYTAVDGALPLKEAIARKFERDNGLAFTPSEISVGAGAKQIIFNALVATLDAGDEVLVPTPCWTSYPEIVRFCGGTPITFSNLEPDFDRLLESIEQSITARTRWLILCSPSNPTGRVYTRAQLQALAKMLEAHPHVLILSDDIYEHIIFDDLAFTTIAQVAPALKNRVLTVNGVSKAYSMTGWRLGYAAGPQELIRQMAKIQSQSTSCASSITQAASLAALDGPQDFVRTRSASFEQRRNLMLDHVRTVPGMQAIKPNGAFYLFCECSALLGGKAPDGTKIETDEQLAIYFASHAGVALVHGAAFMTPGYVRLSFAAPESALIEACSRLASACAALL